MSKQPPQTAPATEAPQPWWRFPIVWMVVGGPLIVVVAGVTTAVIAYKNVDPVMDISKKTDQPNEAPALQGRNKAAENATAPVEH
jgi:uncharacterized protein